MEKLYVFESGSTKTEVFVANGLSNSAETMTHDTKDYKSFSLPGYNPNRPGDEFLAELALLPIHKTDKIYFYGSGLASEIRKRELKDFFFNLFQVDIEVFDDLLGAARALYGLEKGIILIMGTGGIAAFYNGQSITDRCGGYGYLIDDYGGGYELGKFFIAAWLNGDLPKHLSEQMAAHLNMPKSDFIPHYYANPQLGNTQAGLNLVASVTQCIAPYATEKPVKELLHRYFECFFLKSVVSLSQRHQCNEIRVVGSMIAFFSDSIMEVASKYGLSVTKTLRYPALTLFAYHLTTYKTKN